MLHLLHEKYDNFSGEIKIPLFCTPLYLIFLNKYIYIYIGRRVDKRIFFPEKLACFSCNRCNIVTTL